MSPNSRAVTGNNLINITLPLTHCDAQINISKLNTNKLWSTMLTIKKGVANFLSHEKAINGYTAKKLEVESVTEGYQAAKQ